MPTVTVDGLFPCDLDQPIPAAASILQNRNLIVQAVRAIVESTFSSVGSRYKAFFSSDNVFMTTAVESSVNLRRDHFYAPMLDEHGNVKKGIRYRGGMLVYVSKQSSAWGNVKTEDSYVGYITAVGEDELTVVPLAAFPTGRNSWRSSTIYIDGRGYTMDKAHEVVGKARSVSKRCTTILDPLKVPLRTYAEMTIHQRLKRLDSTLTRLKNHLALEKDPRFEKFKLFRASHNAVANHFIPLKCSIRRADDKLRAYVWACLRSNKLAVLNDYRSGDSSAPLRSFWSKHADGLSSSDYTNVGCIINSMVSKWNEKHPSEQLVDTSCGHLAFETVETLDNDLYRDHVCPACAANLRTVEHDDETVLVAAHAELFEQDDGTLSLRKPRNIIGDYHSSKAYVGLLKRPPQMMHVAPSGLTIGIELEMEVVRVRDQSHKEAVARKVLARMRAAHKEGVEISRTSKQYGFFERDGSVSNGFEMVTGWGELSTHEYYIKRIFGVVDGETKLPFSGQLRSHDAEASCGLHVHMAKPESLIHATKLQSFYNADENKLLIRTIARRYDTSYTKVAQGKEKEKVSANAKNALHRTGYVLSRCDSNDAKYAVQKSITKLTESRYDSVNFLPGKTVEIRIFKGSMLPTTIMACIEFAHATWFFCRDAPADALTSDNFLSYIADEKRRHETANLRTYLAARGYKTYQPKYHAGQAKVEHDFNSADA